MSEGVLKWMNREIKPSPPDRRSILRLPHCGRSVQMSSPLARTSPLTARTLQCPPAGRADTTENPRATQAGRLKTSLDRCSSLLKHRWRRSHEAPRGGGALHPSSAVIESGFALTQFVEGCVRRGQQIMFLGCMKRVHVGSCSFIN